METKPIRAFLPVKLSEAERLEAGVKAAELQQELDALKADAKQSAKEYKSRIELLDENFRAHLAGVQTGVMSKETDATEIRDYDKQLQWIEKNGQKFNIQELLPVEESLFNK